MIVDTSTAIEMKVNNDTGNVIVTLFSTLLNCTVSCFV